MGICCMAQETQRVALYQPRELGWGGKWKAVSKGRRYMYTYGRFVLRFDRKQQNSVKQLSLIKNEFLKKWFFNCSSSSSVTQSCLTLCDPMNCSTPGLPFHHQILEIAQTHVHWVGDAIWPSHPLSSPSPPTLNLCQHQGLFKWVSSSHQVAKVLEFQLQHQSFQWTPRTDLL